MDLKRTPKTTTTSRSARSRCSQRKLYIVLSGLEIYSESSSLKLPRASSKFLKREAKSILLASRKSKPSKKLWACYRRGQRPSKTVLSMPVTNSRSTSITMSSNFCMCTLLTPRLRKELPSGHFQSDHQLLSYSTPKKCYT